MDTGKGDTHRSNEAVLVSIKRHRQNQQLSNRGQISRHRSTRVLRRNPRDGNDEDLGRITSEDNAGRKSMEVLR